MSSRRIDHYVEMVREFSARSVLFHEMVAQRLGLHVTDVKALRLMGTESVTAGQLAELSGLTGAAATALVDRLEAAGYVKRKRDTQDRRKVLISAVPQKIRQLDAQYHGLNAGMEKLLSRYDSTQFEAITDYLTRAADVLAQEASALRGQKTTGGR